MSPETPNNPNAAPTYEETAELCARINDALLLASQLSRSPHDERLQEELSKLAGGIIKDSFHGDHHIRLVIPIGSNARTSRNYVEHIDVSPHEFIASSVNRIDVQQADFYSRDDPAVHLTSFDFDLRAEPLG